MARLLVLLAGLLGATGVALAAAAAHVGGGEALRAAAELAMIHAVAVIALLAWAGRSMRPQVWHGVAALMWAGAALFTAALAAATLADLRPVPGAAPAGGSLLILSWLAVAVAALIAPPHQGG
ncbi:MAG: DUF423 domain-containing protein [Hyphomicrobiaceae bacterium]|nr:DUF423 domain-containing protein [Hyphomicrobiaceae bacterium]